MTHRKMGSVKCVQLQTRQQRQASCVRYFNASFPSQLAFRTKMAAPGDYAHRGCGLLLVLLMGGAPLLDFILFLSCSHRLHIVYFRRSGNSCSGNYGSLTGWIRGSNRRLITGCSTESYRLRLNNLQCRWVRSSLLTCSSAVNPFSFFY